MNQTLYTVLNEVEQKAAKALDIRNVRIKDLTVDELRLLGDIIQIDLMQVIENLTSRV